MEMSFKEGMLTGRRNVQSTMHIIRDFFPTEMVLFKDAVFGDLSQFEDTENKK